MTPRWLVVLVCVLVALGMPFWFMVGYWAQDIDPPRGPDISVSAKPAYRPGDPFAPVFHVLPLRACASTSTRAFTSAAVPDRTWSIGAGAGLAESTPKLGQWHDVVVAGVSVPADMPPGPAAFEVTAAFMCNPLRRLFPLIVHYPPVRFTVLPARTAR